MLRTHLRWPTLSTRAAQNKSRLLELRFAVEAGRRFARLIFGFGVEIDSDQVCRLLTSSVNVLTPVLEGQDTQIPPDEKFLAMTTPLPLVRLPASATIHRLGSASLARNTAVLRFPSAGWTIDRDEARPRGWAIVGDSEGRRLAAEVSRPEEPS